MCVIGVWKFKFKFIAAISQRKWNESSQVKRSIRKFGEKIFFVQFKFFIYFLEFFFRSDTVKSQGGVPRSLIMREMLLQNFFHFRVFLQKKFVSQKSFSESGNSFFWQGSNFLQEEMGVNFENAILCRNKQKSF